LANVVVPSVFKTVTALGEPISVYRSDRQRIRHRFFIILAVGLPFLVLALWELFFYRGPFPPLFVGLIIVILVGMLAAARRAGVQWRDTAIVYYGGLAYFNGKTIFIFEWDQIADITVDMTATSDGKDTVATVRHYTITHQNGKQLQLDKMILRFGELCDQVREKTFPYLMAVNRQAFLYGKLVRFGPVAMDKEQGIWVGDNRLRWRDIGQIAVERQYVVVKPKPGRKLRAMRTEVLGVPNLDVCLALAEEMAEEYG
jgi:hypothetical protein